MNEELSLICPECSTANAADAAHCIACGHNLDTIGRILGREQLRFTDRFGRRAEAAPDIQSQEAEDSRQRLAQLWEADRQRHEVLNARQRRQRYQERQLIRGAVVAVSLILLVVILILIAKGG